jgi:hypothetical protein
MEKLPRELMNEYVFWAYEKERHKVVLSRGTSYSSGVLNFRNKEFCELFMRQRELFKKHYGKLNAKKNGDIYFVNSADTLKLDYFGLTLVFTVEEKREYSDDGFDLLESDTPDTLYISANMEKKHINVRIVTYDWKQPRTIAFFERAVVIGDHVIRDLHSFYL